MTALPFATMEWQQADGGPREPDSAGFATFPLANRPESPCAARSLTRSTLKGWGLDELSDDVTVIVSELVTNAMRYGLPPRADHRPLPPASAEQPFLLSLVHYDRSVLCAVFDPGADTPCVKEPDFLHESGRGLHVLQSLAERWGWTTPDCHGKAVWALLLAPKEADDAPTTTTPSADDGTWEPLTRLVLLLELLSGPPWLKALSRTTHHPAEDDGAAAVS
jgi:hypothetical protein